MEKIAISTLTIDPRGALVLDVSPFSSRAYRSVSRRVNRIATLDGGASFTDGGYTDADRTIAVSIDASALTAELDDALQAIVKNHGMVIVATPDGCYNAAPQSYAASSAGATLTFLVKSAGEVRL